MFMHNDGDNDVAYNILWKMRCTIYTL